MSTIQTTNLKHESSGSNNIVLDSSGNIAVQAGTVSAPAIQATGDSNTGIYFPAADTIAFTEGGNEAVRIDSSSRLLVGTSTAPSTGNGQYSKFIVQGGNGTTEGDISIQRNEAATSITSGENIGYINFNDNAGNTFGLIRCVADGTAGSGDYPGALRFETTADSASSPTERMRINSNGQVIINNGSGVTQGTGAGLFVKASTSSSSDYSLHCINSAATKLVLGFRNDGYLRSEAIYAQAAPDPANVHIDTNGYLYRSTSSARYKRDIVSAEYSLALIDKLRPVTYKSTISSPEGQLSEEVYGGFIAEEVDAAGFTEFVNYDPDGQPDALRYGHMIAIAIKGLQEAHTRIQDLEAEVAALKGA